MNAGLSSSWQFWAVLSAIFAALTAIFAKVGVENVNSDLATLIRTMVVLVSLALIVYATNQFQNPADDFRPHLSVSDPVRTWAPVRRGFAIFARSNWAMPDRSRRSTR